MLLQLNLKAAILHLDKEPAAGKSIFDRLLQCLIFANLNDRLERRREVAPASDETTALRRIREQPQRAVNTRLTAAIRAGDQAQLPQGNARSRSER